MATKINPLSRRPRKKRLVMAVRGAAGTGKSQFAASLAEAGVGRLCFFDMERKARLLDGSDGSTFDAIEIYHPDELLEFIDWAVDGEGREQDYGCYVLDSWTMYFGRKYRDTLQRVREQTNDPTAQPTAEQLQNDQIVYQEVLRRLCIESDACVVITDQIGAKGKEILEENEMGKVLPMTIGGLEYYVDVMVEMDVRVRDFETIYVARIIKSNSPYFPIGLEIENPTFADFLARLDDAPQPKPKKVPETIEVEEPPAPTGPTLEQLIERASEYGITREQLSLAARHYQGTAELEVLREEQLADLLSRLDAKYNGAGSEDTKTKKKSS